MRARRSFYSLVTISLASFVILIFYGGYSFPRRGPVASIGLTTTFGIVGVAGIILILSAALLKRRDIPSGEALALCLVSDFVVIRQMTTVFGPGSVYMVISALALIPIGVMMLVVCKSYWGARFLLVPLLIDICFITACAALVFLPEPAPWWPHSYLAAFTAIAVGALIAGIVIRHPFGDQDRHNGPGDPSSRPDF